MKAISYNNFVKNVNYSHGVSKNTFKTLINIFTNLREVEREGTYRRNHRGNGTSIFF